MTWRQFLTCITAASVITLMFVIAHLLGVVEVR